MINDGRENPKTPLSFQHLEDDTLNFAVTINDANRRQVSSRSLEHLLESLVSNFTKWISIFVDIIKDD